MLSVHNAADIKYDEGHPVWMILAGKIRGQFALQKERLLLWIPVLFGVGIAYYFSLPYEPPLVLVIPVFVMGLLPAVLVWENRAASYFHYGTWLIACFLMIVSAGFMVAQYHTHSVAMPMLEKAIGPVEITGRVTEIERLEAGKGNRFILENLQIEKLIAAKTPGRVRIKFHGGDDVHIGDTITTLARLNPPSAPVAPGAFDFQRYAYFKQLGAFGFSYREPEIIRKGKVSTINGYFHTLRQNVIKRIEQVLPYPEASFAITLLSGQRSTIAEEDWEAMRSSGLAHMLAISGLHVGLIAGVIFFTSRLLMALSPSLALKHPIKKYAAVIAFFGALGYTCLVGGSIPTQRAMMMTGIVLLAIILDRDPISLRLLGLAALTILIMMPEALLGAGFQMSFSAVVGLILFYESIRPYWSKWYSNARWFRKALLYLLGVCMTTVIATIATAPFSLYHFQHFAKYGLLANLISVPMMAFVVMPAVVLTFIGMPFGWEGLGLKIMGLGIEGVLTIAHDITAMPDAAPHFPVWPASAFIMMVWGGLFFMLWRGQGKALALIPFVISIVQINNYKQEDILVSSSSDLISVAGQNGDLYVSSLRNDRFTSDIWARRNGTDKDHLIKWPKEGTIKEAGLTCGENGCRIVRQGRHIAVAFNRNAYKDDCDWADLLISQEPVSGRDCGAPHIIDKFDLYYQGAHSVRITKDGLTIESVSSARGQRPWTGGNGR